MVDFRMVSHTMVSKLATAFLFAAVAGAVACTSVSAAETVRGTATFRERLALTPDAVLEVTLQDVSLADAPAKDIGSVRMENPGDPPFQFEIPYEAALIDERHTYVVRATIRAGDSLLFTTDTLYPVLTRGAGDTVDLVLHRVGTSGSESATRLPALPASFEGELPCADCPGIFYHLDLFEDRVFFLRTTYLGRGAGAVRDFIGSWAVTSDDGRLALFGGTEAPIFFRAIDEDTLRKLDVEGRDIESALSYDLLRKTGLDPIEPRLTMRGMYSYMADAALFRECLSGRRFQVAMEADNVALERAYLEARRQPGEELMVSIQGRIGERPAMEGDSMVLSVVPERFLGVWPGESCGARMAQAELEDTYWKLTRLGEEPVFLGDEQREPHMVLRSEDNSVSGFSGCNRLMGGYTVEGSGIEFSRMASTMMACAEGADTERAFTAALGLASSWRLIGHHLDLFDQAGDLVARFEARYMD